MTGDIVAQVESQDKGDKVMVEISSESEQLGEEQKPLKYQCSKCKDSFALKVDLKVYFLFQIYIYSFLYYSNIYVDSYDDTPKRTGAYLQCLSKGFPGRPYSKAPLKDTPR